MSRPLDGPSPKLQTPPGTVDTHIHIYTKDHEGQPGGPPPPAEPATVEDYAVVQKRLGIDRAVIVQSNAYQLDNSCLLEALEQMGDKARGIVNLKSDVTEGELARLDKLGVRGVRIMQLPGGAVGLDQLLPLNDRIQTFGWHPIVQFDGCEMPEHEGLLNQVRGNYIIDHTGKFLSPVSTEHPAFHTLLRLIDRGNCYVKISACYESSRTGGPDFADVGALASKLIEHAPERMLWATNWPHVSQSAETYPDDGALLDLLLHWAPDEKVRQAMFVDNPAKLYGFA